MKDLAAVGTFQRHRSKGEFLLLAAGTAVHQIAHTSNTCAGFQENPSQMSVVQLNVFILIMQCLHKGLDA